MAKIYWRTIKRGARTFAEVPAELKDAVKEIAKQEVEQGIISQEMYNKLIGE